MPPARSAARLELPLFATALFLNAALLFVVEPMFTKMVLPLLGGTPSVWNTCLLFFQATLLAGYLYAHLTARWLGPGRQGALHLALFALSFATLPVAVARGWTPPPGGAPIPWLIELLAVSLGAPFFVLAAGAPLLQRWFAGTGHPDAANPYFLYAASNLGSLLALLAYPLLLEPHLRLARQSSAWSVAYWALAAVMAGCVAVVVREAGCGKGAAGVGHEQDLGVPIRAVADGPAASRLPLPASRRLHWTLLSFAPSSLLLGVTSYISTDVAAVPLLWVIPLALYLLTFVIAFARRQPVTSAGAARMQALLLLPLVITMVGGANKPLWLLATLHLLVFFASALVCHQQLADRRPAVEHLTEFYLWISVGGLLGGIFNVLVAPTLFDRVLEYPLALVLVCALRPEITYEAMSRARRWLERRWLAGALPVVVGCLAAAALRPTATSTTAAKVVTFACFVASALLAFTARNRPLRFALSVAAMLLGGWLAGKPWRNQAELFDGRSFFGVYKVRKTGSYHFLTHGTTLHGGQIQTPQYRTEPLTYYHREGPLGQIFASVVQAPASRRVASVGLGTGTVTCYGRPNERWDVYEIDPLILRIARNPRYFTYLRDCPPAKHIVMGDARLRLADAPPRGYDLVVLDAFSSDAIPIHLITREALALYLSKLADGGTIAFHISNRYLDLEPVLAELARDARLAGVVASQETLPPEQAQLHKTTSTWVVVARRAADLETLARQPGWRPLRPRADVGVWTDDYSNVLKILKFR